MAVLLPYLILVAALAATVGGFTWLAAHIRRRGLAGRAMGAALASYEEAFKVTSYEAHVEIGAQTGRKAPLLSPDPLGGPTTTTPRHTPRGRTRPRRFRRRRSPRTR